MPYPQHTYDNKKAAESCSNCTHPYLHVATYELGRRGHINKQAWKLTFWHTHIFIQTMIGPRQYSPLTQLQQQHWCLECGALSSNGSPRHWMNHWITSPYPQRSHFLTICFPPCCLSMGFPHVEPPCVCIWKWSSRLLLWPEGLMLAEGCFNESCSRLCYNSITQTMLGVYAWRCHYVTSAHYGFDRKAGSTQNIVYAKFFMIQAKFFGNSG